MKIIDNSHLQGVAKGPPQFVHLVNKSSLGCVVTCKTPIVLNLLYNEHFEICYCKQTHICCFVWGFLCVVIEGLSCLLRSILKFPWMDVLEDPICIGVIFKKNKHSRGLPFALPICICTLALLDSYMFIITYLHITYTIF